MDNIQNQLNTSTEESSEVSYCRETTAIRTNLATDESIISQVNIKAKLQSLLAAHTKIDAKIETTEKRIKVAQAEEETLNRNLFNAKQFQNRSLARLERTGERVELVEEKTKRIKSLATDIKEQQEKVIKKLKQNAEQKQKCEEYEKQIATLEAKIKESTDAPEPEFNSKLVEENNNLKEKINHYKEQFKLRQIKAKQLRELKNEKTELLLQIQEKHKVNNLLTVQLDDKKNYLNEKETAFKTKFLQLREKISEKSEVLHQLQQDFQETNQQISSLKSKVDELKSTIAEKEMQLQNMRDNLTQMHTLYEEKVTKQKQLDLESDKLKSLENELQDALKDNETKLKAIMEKSNQLYQLKEEKEELMGKIYTQKNLATTRQHKLTDERNKLNAISEKYTVEQMQVTMLKNKHQTLTENIHKIKIELDALFVKEKEEHQSLELEFSGKIHGLQKEIDLKNANISILMDCELEPALKKIDELKQEINGIEQRKRAEEIYHKMLIQTSERMKKEVNTDKLFVSPKPVSDSGRNTSLMEAENDDSQPASSRKSPLKPQPAETPKSLASHRSESSIANNRTKKMSAKMRNTSLVEAGNEVNQSGTSRKSPGIVKPPLIPKLAATVKKVNTPVIDENFMEAETEDTRGSISGRRSPGILKSPLNKPQNVQTSKRVTFHGVPSSESSTASAVDDGSQKDLDKVLKAWSQFSSSKRNFDF